MTESKSQPGLEARASQATKEVLSGKGGIIETATKYAKKLQKDKWNEQRTNTDSCYLIGRMEELAILNKNTDYKHYTHLTNPNPQQTVNGFYSFKSMLDLYNITTDEYAHLVPLLELRIAHRDRKTKREVASTDVPLQGTYTDPVELLQNPASRSQTLGFKSFNFVFNGKNGFTAKKLIRAVATFHADSLVVFSKPQYDVLLRYRDGNQNALEHVYTVGWAAPANMKNKKLKNTLKEANMQLVCNYVKHTFDINQDGTFTLTIEYVASLDVALSQIDLFVHAEKLKARDIKDQDVVTKDFNKYIDNVLKKKNIAALNDELARVKALQERHNQQMAEMEGAIDAGALNSISGTSTNGGNFVHHMSAASQQMVADAMASLQEQKLEYEAHVQRLEGIISNQQAPKTSTLFTHHKEVDHAKLVSDFIQSSGFDANAAAKWRPYLIEKLSRFKIHRVMEGGTSNTLYEFYADQKEKKMKHRNDGIFRAIVQELEGKDPKTSKIHNLSVKKGEIHGALQIYQATATREPEQLSSRLSEQEQYASVPESDQAQAPMTPDVPQVTSAEDAANQVSQSVKKQAVNVSTTIDKPESEGDTITVPFFYFGDLFDILAKIALQQSNHKKLNFILGTMPYLHPITGKRKIISMADIPISLRSFQAFMHKNYIQNYTQLRLPFISFVSSVITQLIRPAFTNECFDKQVVLGANANRVGMHYKSLLKPLAPGRMSLENLVKAVNLRGSNVECVLIAANMDPNPATGGNFARDIEKGVFHFHLGRDRGLLKKATFSKYDIPELRAHRIFQHADSPIDRMREPYMADLDMIGNNLLYPGTDFYLMPSIPGGENASVARRLGIGGYYKALVVEHNITPGSYTTRVKGSIGTESQSFKKNPKPDVSAIQASKTSTLSGQAVKKSEADIEAEKQAGETAVKAVVEIMRTGTWKQQANTMVEQISTQMDNFKKYGGKADVVIEEAASVEESSDTAEGLDTNE